MSAGFNEVLTWGFKSKNITGLKIQQEYDTWISLQKSLACWNDFEFVVDWEIQV
mgnify:CR=1 FL=1